jgi:hypothetical protein
MSTTIRSAVIEMGIRQLQAKLVPPDVAAIIEAQKSIEAMGVASQRAAAAGSQQWAAFSEQVLALQQQLSATNDTFEKTLADGVAWEDTLPRIASGTNEAAAAGDRHSVALGQQLRGLAQVGHGSMLAARGVLFLAGADKEHQAVMLEKLFLLQGAIDLTKGLGGAMRGLVTVLKEVTVAELALKAINPEFAVVAAALVALASAAGTVYNVLTAQSSAVENLTADYKHSAEQATRMAQLFELQASHTDDLKERLFLLRSAYADVYSEQVKLHGLSEEAARLGNYDEAAKSKKDEIEASKVLLRIDEDRAHAKAHDLELQNKVIDRKLEELRLAKELDDRSRGLAANLFELGPEGRAKRAMALRGTNNAANLGGTNEHFLTTLANDPDPRIRELARTEEARRANDLGMIAPGAAAPVDPAIARDNQIRAGEFQKRENSHAIEKLGTDFDALAARYTEGIRRANQRLDEIENAARAKTTGRGNFAGGWSW